MHDAPWEALQHELAHLAVEKTYDVHLRDDLLQEMRIGLWKSETGKSRKEYIAIAANAARDYLRNFNHSRTRYGRIDYDTPLLRRLSRFV